MVLEKVIAILADYNGADASTIKPETTFAELSLDSLDVAELVMKSGGRIRRDHRDERKPQDRRRHYEIHRREARVMASNRLCELVGIEYPIFQGGMARVANASLASAVSNAGGLGIIAAMNSNADQLRAEISKCRALTEKPFGVNVMLMSPFADEVAAVIAEERIPVVTTGAGNPSKYMESWLAADVKVIPVVPSVALAKMVARRGASAVIAEGGESGGHVGDLTTMALVPQVCDAVEIPVIAAGGHRRRTRRCGGFHARRLRRSARYAVPRRQGMHHPPKL